MLHEKLRCYIESVKLAEGLCKEIAKWPRGFGYLAGELRRAMASVVLNVAEGNARKSYSERRRFFEISRASLAEVSACLDLMRVFSLVHAETASQLKSRLDSVSRMLWALMK